MQKSKLQIKIQNCLLVIGMLFLPYSVFASTVYIDTNHSEFFVGDTILFSVRVDSLNKNINAVEGEVLLDYAVGTVSLTDINTAGSALSLWPNKPLPNERNTRLSFAGGSPGGFNSKDAIVFNIVLKLQETGQVALSPSAIGVYIHDGKGTRGGVSVKELVIDVLPKEEGVQSVDDWSSVIAEDTTPPEFVEAIISRDPHLFDNQYFVSFFATDKGSGIAYYEIKEGELDFIRAESPYLLKDQSLKRIVQIKAVDKARNESVITAELAPVPGISYKTYLIWGLIMIAILVIVFWLWRLWRIRRAKLRNNVQNESR